MHPWITGSSMWLSAGRRARVSGKARRGLGRRAHTAQPRRRAPPAVAHEHAAEGRALNVVDEGARVPSDQRAAVGVVHFLARVVAVGEEGEELLAHPHREVRRLVERVAAEVEEGVAVRRLAGEVRARHHVRPRLVDW